MSISGQIPTDATSADTISNLAENLSEAFTEVFRAFQNQDSAGTNLNRSTSSQTSEATTVLTVTSAETVASTKVDTASEIAIIETAYSDDTATEVSTSITLTTTDNPQVLEGPELVTNGDFEDHGALNRSTWGTFETIPGWTATEGKIEIQEGSHGGTPDVASDQGFLEVDGAGGKNTNSAAETTVTVETAGAHKLTFDYSPRGAGGADTAETSQVNVIVNGEIVDTISSEAVGFEQQVYTVNLPAGENTISFQAAGSDDGIGGLIDNVSVKSQVMVSGPHEGLSAELITNGDFEDHGDLNRSTWGTFETIAGWEATEGKIEIQEGSHGGTPDVANDQGFLEVDSHGGKDTNSTVETSVTVEEAGLHKLTFDYSPRGEDGADAAETSQVNVLVNGKVVDTISSETIGFEKQEYTLSLPAGENTISFQAAGTDDSLGGLIDNVSLKGPPAADARGPELVINGDFETHGDLNRSTWGTFETISGWEATEGNIEIQEGSHGGTPDVASDQGFLEVDSHGGTDTNSTVETRVIIEEAGTHELTFDYSPREKNGADTAETSQVNVLVNGEIVDTISSDTVGFEIQTFTLNLPAGETRSHSKL